MLKDQEAIYYYTPTNGVASPWITQIATYISPHLATWVGTATGLNCDQMECQKSGAPLYKLFVYKWVPQKHFVIAKTCQEPSFCILWQQIEATESFCSEILVWADRETVIMLLVIINRVKYSARPVIRNDKWTTSEKSGPMNHFLNPGMNELKLYDMLNQLRMTNGHQAW